MTHRCGAAANRVAAQRLEQKRKQYSLPCLCAQRGLKARANNRRPGVDMEGHGGLHRAHTRLNSGRVPLYCCLLFAVPAASGGGGGGERSQPQTSSCARLPGDAACQSEGGWANVAVEPEGLPVAEFHRRFVATMSPVVLRGGHRERAGTGAAAPGLNGTWGLARLLRECGAGDGDVRIPSAWSLGWGVRHFPAQFPPF